MIKTILFDVDGVMLSEERYFDASALTVWEMLHSPQYLGLSSETFAPAPKEEDIRRIRQLVFADDEVLNFIKSRGINSNWDMVYLAVSYQIIRLCGHLKSVLGQQVTDLLTGQINRAALARLSEWAKEHAPDFTIEYAKFTADFSRGNAQKAEMLLYLNQIAQERCGIVTNIFSRNSDLWKICQETFQEWYLGDERVSASIGRETLQPGKKGFLNDEIPIVSPAEMIQVFRTLKEKGYTLGIGTGRPTIETHVPLEALGILEWFDPNRVVTASHVLEAEEQSPAHAPLSKPHPFSYVKGLLGLDTPNSDVLRLELPISNGDEVLVVGDSLADLLAARSMGCRFAATLTGLSGQEARSKFEEEKADYILDDVRGILSILE
ncbi:HAD family hydrolase [Brevibacillus composti]|uniref:HAD family hydrolase n=1 Tax=Brevibacillus composti TaxID=2796470 RepID=A0A7T5EHS4_9BACL|nr:HAD family hydrolase [Brevibacillus composti]QQE72815.1 HAD family hydrolase [Brevibacillus composti]QUO39893.1 HAD family hydrolase [Brevibacillus composti]